MKKLTYYNQVCYNMKKAGDNIIIIRNKTYERDLKKKIISKHKNKELANIYSIEYLIKKSQNFKELLSNPESKLYNIKKKSGNLKEIYTAYVNSKIRLYIKPYGDYPYNLAEIEKIEFIKIDDKHYGEG